MAFAGDSEYGNIHDLVTCPYDPNHKVGFSRFPNHLVKCREQCMQKNPDIATRIAICLYNQSHHVPAEYMSEHLTVCQSYRDHLLHSYNTCTPEFLPKELHKKTADPKTIEAGKKKLEKAHMENFQYQFTREELEEWM